MKRMLAALAALVLTLSFSFTAHAQERFNNVVRNSGNGIGNTIQAINRGVPAPYWTGPIVATQMTNYIINSGNGINNTIVTQNLTAYQPYLPLGGAYVPPFPGVGGVNVNVITNSANGIGNLITTGNAAGPGALNINVITNSGNGAGNTIQTLNQG